MNGERPLAFFYLRPQKKRIVEDEMFRVLSINRCGAERCNLMSCPQVRFTTTTDDDDDDDDVIWRIPYSPQQPSASVVP